MPEELTAETVEEQGTPPDAETPAEGQAAPEPDSAAQYQNFVQDVTTQVLEHLRPLLDNNFRGTQAQVDRLSTQITHELRDLGASKGDIAYVKELIEESLQLTDDQRKALRDRTELQERRAKDNAQKDAPAATVRPTEPDDFDTRFKEEIAPDLEDYGRLKGFSEQEMAADNWNGRLLAAGAPSEITLTPQGIRAYKASMKKAMDKVAQEAAAARKPRTVVPNPPAGGAARPKDLATYRDSLKKGDRTPSAAEIDAMTAHYLTR